MAVDYQWKITSLKTVDTDDITEAVYEVCYKVTGSEDGHEGIFRGGVKFDVKELDPSNITPFLELTEEQVIGWVKASLSENVVTRMNNLIAKQIHRSKTELPESEPVPPNKMPWTIQDKHLK